MTKNHFPCRWLLALALSIYSCQTQAVDKATTDNNTDNSPQQQATETVPQSAVLYFVGDAMQHLPQINRAKLIGKNNYDYSDCFSLLEPTIKGADYAVVNLEVPLGGAKRVYSGYPMFNCPDEYAIALKDAGFDMFLTANNHMLDRNDEGLRRTLSVLDSIGVDHTGTFANRQDRLYKTPFIKDINGIKFGFLNYTYGTNGIVASDGAEVNYIDRDEMKREIDLTKDQGAEIIVVAIHWGDEYRLHENAEQRQTADFLLEQGVDMIIGSHPHVVEPMHLVDNPVTGHKSLIVYSLGNFLSNQNDIDSRGGASVTCTIERNDKGEAIVKEAFYDTFFTAKPYNATSNYQVVPASMPEFVPANQKSDWEKFNRNSEALFTKENKGVDRVSYQIAE